MRGKIDPKNQKKKSLELHKYCGFNLSLGARQILRWSCFLPLQETHCLVHIIESSISYFRCLFCTFWKNTIQISRVWCYLLISYLCKDQQFTHENFRGTMAMQKDISGCLKYLLESRRVIVALPELAANGQPRHL